MIELSLLVLIGSILIVNFLFTGWFIRYAKVRRLTDIPTERSSHEKPTPKGGGVGFVAVSLAAFAVYIVVSDEVMVPGLLVFLSVLIAAACLGWFDDKHDLSKRIRFGIQSFAALAVILFISGMGQIFLPFVGVAEAGLLGSVLAFVWITGTANIYNFMDGVDGIASVQALGATVGWILFAWVWNLPELLAINIFVLSAVSVFLWFNWAPAKLFMGDVGSLFLGFMFAGMPFLAAYLSDSIQAGETIWIAGLLLWPFLFDGTYTIFRRLSREENIFDAHRSHLYQRLNIAGWGHCRISKLYLSFSVFCIFCALLFYYGNDWIKAVVLAGLILLSFVYAAYVNKVEARVSEEPGSEDVRQTRNQGIEQVGN